MTVYIERSQEKFGNVIWNRNAYGRISGEITRNLAGGAKKNLQVTDRSIWPKLKI